MIRVDERRRAVTALAGAALVVLTGACALTSKATPVDVRYFTPEAQRTTAATALAADASAPARTPPAEASSRRLRLGHVAASAHLRARIVVRRSPHELGTYEYERWTESPEEYVRRGLERALFAERGLARVMGGTVPTLDAELLAFEQTARGPSSCAGRVEIAYVLHDDRDVIASQRVEVERPASSCAMEDVVAAIGASLDAATSEVAAAVAAKLPPER